MDSLNYSVLQNFVCFVAGFSTYLSALFGFMSKWLSRLNGEYPSLCDESVIDSENMSLESKEEPESFLFFRFQRYEEFIDRSKSAKVDTFSESSNSDEEFYDPCYDPPVMDDEDSDGSISDEADPLVCLNTIPLQGHENVDSEPLVSLKEYEDLKPEKRELDESCVVKGAKAFVDEGVDFELLSGSDSDSGISSSNFSLRSSLLDSIKDGYSSSSDDDDKEEDKIEINMLSKGLLSDDVEENEEVLSELKGIEEEVAKEGKRANEDENDEENGMERQWEHQNLIEQLKMEIGKVKAIGLPTIFEDYETPKMADDLKPWKIEEKLLRSSGTKDEVHWFYKSYRERMRKFDIFNYQKMYAIGFLKLKDPVQSFSPQKISLATIVSQDCWPCKPTKATSNYSVLKFTRELESDLETVYVGQLCLSWEFLRWEYGKALALWDSDPHEIRRFNEVAGEFQQFQVLLQRFLEDEPFRSSSRVQNYVKDRCLHRRLLQVPVIREDSAKDRMKQRRNGVMEKDAITSVIIIETIEESIRLLWQLIRTDKDAATSKAIGPRKASHVELQDPEDAEVLLEVQETLRKKQKALKELTRRECCVMRKLQRKHAKLNYAGKVLCFFSQVDMKLVSRVLNMTRLTTDQLGWCTSKLENIEFVDNGIRREPSFLMFPCS